MVPTDDDDFEPGTAQLVPKAGPRARVEAAHHIRPARFAGRYYPQDPEALRRAVHALLPKEPPKRKAVGMVLPHGPLSYIARYLSAAFAEGALEEVVVIIAPNHAERGARAAIVAEGAFELPTGQVPIDDRVGESIRSLAGMTEAALPVAEDHAIEVILPALLAAQPELSIVPIQLHGTSPQTAARFGASIADVVTAHGGGVTIVATTDLAHYATKESVDLLTLPLLERVEQLDPEGVLETVASRSRSSGPLVEMCGLGPLLVLIHALRALDAKRGRVVARGSSLENRGETGSAVAYASVVWAHG